MHTETDENMGSRAAKLIYPLFIGQFLGLLLTAATFIAVTRILGPSQYGIYVFAFGFSALVNAVAAFGIGTYWNRQLATLHYNKDGEGILKELSSGYAIVMAVGIILSVFGIAISGYVAGLFPNIGIQPITLELASTMIFFLMVNTAAVHGLVGLSRAGLAAVSNIIVDIVQLVLSIILTIAYGINGSVEAMLIGYVVGAVITAYFIYIAVSRYVKFRIRLPSRQELMNVLSFATPLAANNFLNTGMQSFSILFLGFYVMTAALGNYGAANKGLTLLSVVYGSFAMGILATFTTARTMKKPGDVNRTYNAIIRFSLMLTLPMIMFVGAMSVPGLYLLVSSSFSTAPLYLTLMALGTMIGIFGIYISNLLISGNHTKSVLKVNLISAAVQLALLIALVPSAQIIGAIVAIYFVGNLVEAVMFAVETKRKFGLVIEYRNMALIYLSSILIGVMIMAWLFASGGYLLPLASGLRYVIQLAVGVAILIVIYPIILTLLKAVDMKDIEYMRLTSNKLGRVGRVIGILVDYSEYLNKSLMQRA
ncbi:MAG: oligosaccharide flippase family protein [Candidatus Micrarchaeaceae archaeon]